ncbi:MAG: D-amino acid aminotransferase [Pseudomonadota bacterium]
MSAYAYLNGDYLPAEEACVPVMDRGFLFGDSVYEVIPAYAGHAFHLDAHLDRLQNSLSAIGMDMPRTRDEWHRICAQLLSRFGREDAAIYVQVTRGVGAVRDHASVEGLEATVFAMVRALPAAPAEKKAAGISAITLDDIRWHRCDIKTTALLANVLARASAREEGADEALLLRDGLVSEGAASNLFVVLDGLLVTPPKSSALLPGITRDLVLELATEAGIRYTEASIAAADLERAEEIWTTSSTKEVLPVVKLNGRAVGAGKPGPLWHAMVKLFDAHKARLQAGR